MKGLQKLFEMVSVLNMVYSDVQNLVELLNSAGLAGVLSFNYTKSTYDLFLVFNFHSRCLFPCFLPPPDLFDATASWGWKRLPGERLYQVSRLGELLLIRKTSKKIPRGKG